MKFTVLLKIKQFKPQENLSAVPKSVFPVYANFQQPN